MENAIFNFCNFIIHLLSFPFTVHSITIPLSKTPFRSGQKFTSKDIFSLYRFKITEPSILYGTTQLYFDFKLSYSPRSKQVNYIHKYILN